MVFGFCYFFSLGMHRKSQEAAEALNNEESGGSDREDTQSKQSDISITSPGSNKPKTPSGSTSSASAIPTSTPSHDSSISRHSVTPTSSSTIPTAPKTASPSNKPASPHHHNSVEPSKANGEMPLVGSPPHVHFHPESDPEAFRWVDYHRDPISYIRCDLFNKPILIPFDYF